VFMGHYRREVVARNTGLDQLEHHASNFGWSEKEGKSCPHAFGFLHALSSPPVSCLCSFYPRPHGCACVAGGGDPAQEAATTTEATHAMAVLATESSDQEDAVVRDNAALHVRDVED
jgi:hypothetical protein